MNIQNIRTLKQQGGFTLIELMIVIAILAILMAIAIPAYQNYTIRANVSECVNVAAAAKLAVSETAISEGIAPTAVTDAASAGFVGSATDFCAIPAIANGVITIAVQAATGTTGNLVFTPRGAVGENVQWNCTSTMESRYVPATCRGT